MDDARLTDQQLAVVRRRLDTGIFLEGPAGTGKTTAGVARLLRLLREGVPADAVLVLLPQRTLATPYAEALRRPAVPPGGEVTVVTLGGLAQRMVELFWPQVAAPAGFAMLGRPPVFLTLETAQYYMARLVRPLLDKGYFDSIKLDRNRLYSQILDNLNKAAAVGFPHTEIASRLKTAWIGDAAQARVYDEAQECAELFRSYCLANNLLDFSLQYEVFAQHLWPLPACRRYLAGRYTHLIVDNAEEDTPVAHDIVREWLPGCGSALLICDRDAGYRRFLGADPESAYRLQPLCDESVSFSESFVMSPDVQAFSAQLGRALGGNYRADPVATVRSVLTFASHRYHPEMLDWVADEVAGLVHGQGVTPGEIAVLAPFLTGALRFSLADRLARRDVPVRSHRPSRSLREEPATQCLLTLAALCHPGWAIVPTKFDVAYALMLAIADLDLVRAQLLAEISYRVKDGVPILSPFVEIEPAMQERITFLLGGRYEGLRTWAAANNTSQMADSRWRSGDSRQAARKRRPGSGRDAGLEHFLARLFGELLSQPGYGFHRNYDAGEITAKLIESVRKFRQVMTAPLTPPSPLSLQGTGGEREDDLGREYMQMVQDGVVAAQYVRSWQRQPKEAVLLAPAHTFLMSNRVVAHQFWLDVGGMGWWERLYQPLTHPYVLRRGWPEGSQWTDVQEFGARQEALAALVTGLLRRCRVQVHLGLSEFGEQGSEQRGPLLQAVQRVLRGA